MIKRILPFILFFFSAGMCYGQDKPLVAGMKILRTMKIKKAVYQIEAPADTAKPVLFIEGDNITIDFNNAEMNGSNRNKNPEEFSGVAILIRNSKNVTIRNLKARGYKIALLARNVEKLTLDNCDFSYNYRQQSLCGVFAPQIQIGRHIAALDDARQLVQSLRYGSRRKKAQGLG